MNSNTKVKKYMCTVETKNYAVATIYPTINRYGSVRKKFTASEIAQCLSACATVTLHKNNGSNVKLTAANFKQVILKYNNELTETASRIAVNKQEISNHNALEQLKANVPVAEFESLEIAQDDPEVPEADWSHIYGDEETDNADETEEK